MKDKSMEPIKGALSSSAPIVSLTGVSKTFYGTGGPLTVLEALDLEVSPGEMVVLMGPSGSGKSTLLHLIAGLDRPTQGEIRVAGTDVVELSESALARFRSESIGLIFQNYHLIPVLSARANVELPLFLTRLNRRRRRERAQAALELVGLGDRASHLPRQLSGGQEQRVAIARALVADPQLLLADEPTGNLDAESAHAVLELLQTLTRRLEKTVVMVTHDPGAAQWADRTIRLQKGQLEAAA